MRTENASNTMQPFIYKSPAKLNFYLEILGKRNDGFHELETVMNCVTLYDSIRFRTLPRDSIELSTRWAGGISARDISPSHRFRPSSAGLTRHSDDKDSDGNSNNNESWGDLPTTENNLVYRAAKLIWKYVGEELGTKIELVKRIPSAAGLGGASSNAATTLLAMNQIHQLGLSREELLNLAAELGSDVPFFIDQRTAICRGRGEKIEHLQPVSGLNIVIARPPVGLSTAEIFKNCELPTGPRSVQPLINAIGGDAGQFSQLLFNRLQEAAEKCCKWIGDLKRVFAHSNCLGHMMTGSGSCYFGIFRGQAEAKAMVKKIGNQRMGYALFCKSYSRSRVQSRGGATWY